MEAMIALWQRIEQWLSNHSPTILDDLNPGASEEELAQAETALGIPLPEDFKASYRIHNGGGTGLLEGMGPGLCPLRDVVGIWQMYQDLKEHEHGWAEEAPSFLSLPKEERPPIQPMWWHPRLIPFTDNESGGNWCVDLDPVPGGQRGQIVDWEHESGPTNVLFPSLEALLSQVADDLEADKYLSFDRHLERRLTEGQEAKDQARRYDFEQPSPGQALLEEADQLRRQTSGTSESQKTTHYEQVIAKYRQVLQSESARSIASAPIAI